MQTLPALIAEWVILIFVAGAALVVLWKLWTGTIDLSGLITEIPSSPPAPAPGLPPPPPGPAQPPKASMSRFQLLLFTFVIAGLYLTLSLEAGRFVDMPNQVLGLLGISGASYVVSKGIQKSK
jgi:hypothetical protein